MTVDVAGDFQLFSTRGPFHPSVDGLCATERWEAANGECSDARESLHSSLDDCCGSRVPALGGKKSSPQRGQPFADKEFPFEEILLALPWHLLHMRRVGWPFLPGCPGYLRPGFSQGLSCGLWLPQGLSCGPILDFGESGAEEVGFWGPIGNAHRAYSHFP